SRRRHTRFSRDWSSDVCSSDLNDAVLTKGNYSQLLPSIHAGIWLYSPNFFIGAAAQNLVESKLTFNSHTPNPDSKLYRHYFVTRSEERRVGKEGRSRW